MLLYINYCPKYKVQDLNLLNIQLMVLLLPVQLIWVPERDNQFSVNSQILHKRVKMKKDLKILQNNSDYKLEVWVDNIHQWILKELLIFHRVQDLE
jgi:hypothetical protein